MKLLNHTLLFILAFSYFNIVLAEGSINGYGTFGFSCFSNDYADYTYEERPEGPGYTRQCSFELDSNLGIQANWELNQDMQATLQATSFHRNEDDFTPEMTLAYLQWQASGQQRFRIGRVQNPNFLYSEYRLIHFAQPSARPQRDLYTILSTSYFDGIEFLNHSQLGDWQAEWHFGLGSASYDLLGLDISVDSVYALLTLEQNSWLFKIGLAPSLFTVQAPFLDSIFDGLRSFGEDELADDLEMDDARSTIFSLGMRFDNGDWLVVGEFATRPSEGFGQQGTSAYITLGRRYGLWMPNITLARHTGRQDDADNTLDPTHPMYDAVEQLLSFVNDSHRTTLAFGLNREINEKSTLKLQVDFIQPDRNSRADYGNVQNEYDATDPELDTLFTLNLDFVF